MSYGWNGAQCRLVPLERARHLENCVRWINNPVVTQWLIVGDFPLTMASEEAWFEGQTNDPKRVNFAIETFAGEHVGNIGLHNIDYRHAVGAVGVLIGDPRNWRLGYGTDSLRTLTRYAIAVVGLRLLLAEVMAENEASVALFRKVGYQEYGRIPQRWWKRGAFRDEVIFCYTREQIEREAVLAETSEAGQKQHMGFLMTPQPAAASEPGPSS